MMMKNQEFLPAYNILASSEEQFITAVTVHQNPNDAIGFKEHLNSFVLTPKRIVADGVFGTEENYQLLESKEVESYLKYPLYYKEQGNKFKSEIYRKENFSYDATSDTYECPQKQRLHYTHTRHERQKSGFEYTSRAYEASNCRDCPVRSAFTKSQEGNRTIQVNVQLDAYKQIARNNLNSEQGIALRKKRGWEIETCFGDMKHNMKFQRFNLRGLMKVKTEITIVSIAHNLRKLHLNVNKRAA